MLDIDYFTVYNAVTADQARALQRYQISFAGYELPEEGIDPDNCGQCANLYRFVPSGGYCKRFEELRPSNSLVPDACQGYVLSRRALRHLIKI